MINIVREIRKEQGLSIVSMAEFCQVSRQSIHAIENQKLRPTVYLALRIAKFLNVKVEDVFILEVKHD